MTMSIEKMIDVLDKWCLIRILIIHWSEWSEHVPNLEVCLRTQQPLLSDVVRARHLCFFGHVCRADSYQDHHRALRANIGLFGLPKDWKRRPALLRPTWLCTMEKDVSSFNPGLPSAYQHARNWSPWRSLVEMATSWVSECVMKSLLYAVLSQHDLSSTSLAFLLTFIHLVRIFA